MSRYRAQEILPQIGPRGQSALRKRHVLIVGAGGLGVPALQYLIGAGVGRITLVDPDRVEIGNLHRQVIYGGAIGALKVDAAAAFALRLNPEVTLTPVAEWLTPRNAPDLVAAADLVLDCADRFSVSYLLSDLCFARGTPLISASALGLSGYVGGFCGAAPSLRAVFPDLPEVAQNCATAGVLGPVVGMFGTLQAQMALAHMLSIGESPLGRLWRFDLESFRFSELRFQGAPEPYAPPHAFIAAEDLRPEDFVVELRDTIEAPKLLTPQAQRYRVADFGRSGPKPGPGQRIVFICRSGLRAWAAADRLRPHCAEEIALLADVSSEKG